MNFASCRAVLVMGTVGLVACAQPDREPSGDDHDRDLVAAFYVSPDTQVDLLFVIDTSPSMAQEQEALAEQVRLIARELITPSEPGEPRAHELHVGVVTADMDDPSTGGVLRNASGASGCAFEYSARDCDRDASCPWLSQSILDPDDGTDPDDPPLWDDLACIVQALGTSGSTVERPLDAALTALTTQARPGMPNEGFLRDRSLLGIVFITDEDDCSGLDLTDSAEPGIECIDREAELALTSDFHDALVSLLGGDENRIVVSAIAGIPVDGSWNPGDRLAELRELRHIEGTAPAPDCESTVATAVLPLRLVELVYSFGIHGHLESICRPDWTWAVEAFHGHGGALVGPACLYVPIGRDAASICEMTVVTNDAAECAGLADVPGPDRTTGWSVDLGLDGDGKRVCGILAADLDGDACPDGALRCPPEWADMGTSWSGREWDAGGDGLHGWLIDHSDPECEFGELRFTDHVMTATSGLVRLECLE